MKHKLKPFEPVLARTSENAKWFATFYGGHAVTNNNEIYYTCCGGGHFRYCIPYNENTAHLLGTRESYKEPEPKVWCVKNLSTNRYDRFTQKQFESFIKDISNNQDGSTYYIHYDNNN